MRLRDDDQYWQAIERRAKELRTDGCSGLVQWYRKFCWEHDIHYRTHEMLDGTTIGKWMSDAIFVWRHVNMSPTAAGVGIARWIGLTFGGWFSWYDEDRGSPVADYCEENAGAEGP
jgi:hypothetical protein